MSMAQDTLRFTGNLALTGQAETGLIAARYGQVAQLVEQRIENPRVGGSIPPLATIPLKGLQASLF